MVDEGEISPMRLEDHLCFAAYSTVLAFNRVYRPLLERLGLTYPQYLVMLTLWERDDRTVKELGEPLHLDSGTLTPLLKRLEAAGLVVRQRNKDDERQVRLTLTAKGHALRKRAEAVPKEIACAIDRPLEEIERLKESLFALRDRLNAAEGDTAK